MLSFAKLPRGTGMVTCPIATTITLSSVLFDLTPTCLFLSLLCFLIWKNGQLWSAYIMSTPYGRALIHLCKQKRQHLSHKGNGKEKRRLLLLQRLWQCGMFPKRLPISSVSYVVI
jgi:hypothetical protein